MNTRILCIETSAAVCSVAFFEGQACQKYIEEQEHNKHAEVLPVLVKNLMDTFGKPQVIAVNIGPGSYTGLRIGLSLAKGICVALNIPLITLTVEEVLAQQLISNRTLQDCEYISVMIDAGRMEVYAALFDTVGQEVEAIKPVIIDETFLSEYIGKKLLIGNGSIKCKPLLGHRTDIVFGSLTDFSAAYLGAPAYDKFVKNNFADLAYCEPVYLKTIPLIK